MKRQLAGVLAVSIAGAFALANAPEHSAAAAAVIAPPAQQGPLGVTLTAQRQALDGTWRGALRLAGLPATATSTLAVSTYAQPGCSGAVIATATMRLQTTVRTSFWIQGPAPAGSDHFSARAVLTAARQVVSSACNALDAAGQRVPAVRSISSGPARGAFKASPGISLTMRYHPFPHNVSWSALLSLTGGSNPGGSITVTQYFHPGCTPSDWQYKQTLTFGAGYPLNNYEVTSYNLPDVNDYSADAVYSGDGSNNAVSTSCVPYSVSATPTGDTLNLSPNGGTFPANSLVNLTTSFAGFTSSMQTLLIVHLYGGSSCFGDLTSWGTGLQHQPSGSFVAAATIPKPGSYALQAETFPDPDNSGVSTPCAGLTSQAGPNNSAGDFFPVTPFRVLDTRYGIGAPQHPLSAGARIDVPVTGVPGSGVPAAGVSAVVVNITAVGASGGSYLAVWPTGLPQPRVSSLNFGPHQTIANLVTTRIGSGGKLSIFNKNGSVDVLGDVLGWYSDGTTAAGNRLTAASPQRILDTRYGIGAPAAPLGASQSIDLTVAGANGVPGNATAVVLNVTATGTSAGSFLTVWPKGQGRPTASNLNWTPGTTIANLVMATVGSAGKVSIYNLAGRTDVIADVMGWFVPAASNPSGSQYYAVAPFRILDTRICDAIGFFLCPMSLNDNQQLGEGVTGNSGVVSGALAMLLNVTATNTSAASYLTVWPAGQARPNASNLNWSAGETIPNAVLSALGTDSTFGPGSVSVYNHSGHAAVIIDISGYFV